MRKRESGTECEPFKRGERGYVKFPCPQCRKGLMTPIDFPGWYECPNCQRKIFWREAKAIAVRVKSGKCEICREPVPPGGIVCGSCLELGEVVRVLRERIESLEADNKILREVGERLSGELDRAAGRCTLGYQIRVAAERFWQDRLYWKFVVLILAIEAIRLGIDILRFGR